MQWNARGAITRLPELKKYLLENKIDLICLQETLLSPTKNFNLPGYSIIRCDVIPEFIAHGGVLIAVADHLHYLHIELKTQLQALAVKIFFGNRQYILINMYNPPGINLDLNSLQEILKEENVIFLGDFNAHHPMWTAKKSDQPGIELVKLCDNNNLALLNTSVHTYLYHNGSTSLLDLSFVSAKIALDFNFVVETSMFGSDHFPVRISIDSTEETESAIPRINYRKINWIAFRQIIENEFANYLIPTDVQQFYKQFVEKIISSASRSSPPPSSRKRNRKSLPYWTASCRSAVSARNRALRIFQRSKKSEDGITYRQKKAIAQREIRSAQKTCWQNYCSSLTEASKLSSVWNMARKMTGKTSGRRAITLIKSGKPVTNSHDVAELFVEHYSNVSSNCNLSSDLLRRRQRLEKKWEKSASKFNSKTASLNLPFTFFELENAIKFSKKKTAPGQDTITYEILKNLPKSCLDILLQLYNKIWETTQMPAEWKNSIVIPILKKGENPHEPGSYRPISLTSTICKIHEKMIANRLYWYFENNNLFKPEQAGFRRAHSTADQMLRLHDSIEKGFSHSHATLAVFLDFSKAFDMVWINGLLYKLRRLHIFGNLYCWIENFLSDRQICVRISDQTSSPKKLENGTPQGSVISPLLFLIMVNDFPDTEKYQIHASLFADDSAIWKTGKSFKFLFKKVQQSLDDIEKWCSKWGFLINLKKTVFMSFSRGRKPEADLSLTLKNQKLSAVDSFRFLGLTFTPTLNWKLHITTVAEKCHKALNLLRSVSSKSWGANKKTTLLLYNALIKSRLTYGGEILYTASSKDLQKLDSIQYQALRIATRALPGTPAIAIQNETGEMPLAIYRKQQLFLHFVNMKRSKLNPASECIHETWLNTYGHLSQSHRLVSDICKPIKPIIDRISDVPVASSDPFWDLAILHVDISLSEKICKKTENIIVMKNLALEVMENYQSFTAIYTDGSKSGDKTGFAFYSNTGKMTYIARFSGETSIFHAELSAILAVFQYILGMISSLHSCAFAIFTDSLSVATYLKLNFTSFLLPAADEIRKIFQILHKANIRIALIWIPSHVGLTGNEKADYYAKRALSDAESVIIPLKLSIIDAKHQVKSVILDIWQQFYDSKNHASLYKQVEPKVSNEIKYFNSNRQVDVIVTRLRLGRCLLNYYLYQQKMSDTKNCLSCKIPENIEHFLLYCDSNGIKFLHNYHTLAPLLQDHGTMEKIAKYIIFHKIKI